MQESWNSLYLANLLIINLVQIQRFSLELVCDQEVVDDVVLVVGVGEAGDDGVVGHVVHLGVDVLLLVPRSENTD